MNRTLPIVRRAGGKSSLLKHLLPLVPADARCYVEVFGGGAALLLALPRQSCRAEVYNDADGDLFNAFLQAKNHPEAVIAELDLRLNCRRMFQEKSCGKCLTEIQRAAVYLHRNAISFGGDNKSFGVQKISGGGSCSSLEYIRVKIRAFAARFDRVAVENLDWRRCLDLYDTPETFFFLDPPYADGKQNHYKRWSVGDFRGFAALLATLKGRWLLTVSDTPEMREIFAGRSILEVHRAKGIRAANPNVDRYAELIIQSHNAT